jgi:hypothetical protein
VSWYPAPAPIGTCSNCGAGPQAIAFLATLGLAIAILAGRRYL